jgi:hypothetical protein
VGRRKPERSSSSEANGGAIGLAPAPREVFGEDVLREAAAAMGPVADLIAPHLEPEPGKAGRKAKTALLGLLVGIHLACADSGGSAVHLSKAAEILGWRIPGRWRSRFGIEAMPETARGFEALYARLRRLHKKITRPMEPSPVPIGTRLTLAQEAEFLAKDDPARAAGALALLDTVINQILESSLTRVRHLLEEYWDGAIGLDSTAVAAFARGPRPASPLTSRDPAAGWYGRGGDHGDPHEKSPTNKAKSRSRSKSRGHRYLYGYQAHPATSAHGPNTPWLPAGFGPAARLPPLTLALATTRPGTMPGKAGLRALSSISARGYTPGEGGADRAYNSSPPGDFQLPARALGYRFAYDYPSTALGIQAPGPGGAVMIEGGWHCPATPARLAETSLTLKQHTDRLDAADQATATATDNQNTSTLPERNTARATWIGDIRQRGAYRLTPKGRPDAEGHQRFSCPAATGQVRCPLKPASLTTSPRRALPLIEPEPGPGGPPAICTQDSITIEPEAGAKHFQDLPYRSPQWQARYQPLRANIEGTNGHAKDGAFENIQSAQGRRILGQASHGIALAIQIAHDNTRKIDNRLDTLPLAETGPRRRTRRRTTKPLGDWTPRGRLSTPPDPATMAIKATAPT